MRKSEVIDGWKWLEIASDSVIGEACQFLKGKGCYQSPTLYSLHLALNRRKNHRQLDRLHWQMSRRASRQKGRQIESRTDRKSNKQFKLKRQLDIQMNYRQKVGHTKRHASRWTLGHWNHSRRYFWRELLGVKSKCSSRISELLNLIDKKNTNIIPSITFIEKVRYPLLPTQL